MSRHEYHEDAMITVWGLGSARIGNETWVEYLQRERERLARKGIFSEIAEMPVVRTKKGKDKHLKIYALKRKIQ